MDMEEENKVIQFGKVSRKPSATLKRAGIEEATKAAQMILSCYPDFGKSPPEYIVNVIDVLATFPSKTLPKLCNLRDGIPGRCKYLPTIADIVVLAESYETADHIMAEARARDEHQLELAEAREKYWADRNAELEKAKAKYRTAFLDVHGDIRYYPDLEKAQQIGPNDYKVGDYVFKKPTGVA